MVEAQIDNWIGIDLGTTMSCYAAYKKCKLFGYIKIILVEPII